PHPGVASMLSPGTFGHGALGGHRHGWIRSVASLSFSWSSGLIFQTVMQAKFAALSNKLPWTNSLKSIEMIQKAAGLHEIPFFNLAPNIPLGLNHGSLWRCRNSAIAGTQAHILSSRT